MSKTHISMTLPKEGDRLVRIMTGNNYDPEVFYNPEPCVVTYVNEKNRWYEVKFFNSNLKECYSTPVFDHSILKGKATGGIPVLCVETGDIYSSLTECAKDMNLTHAEISRQIAGFRESCRGYHFSTIL